MTEPESLTLGVVVYGIINAGKSSLINALVETATRTVGPIGGTTAEVAEVEWALDASPDLTRVRLIDTPGLEEVDQAGVDRGELAMATAAGADLILFVLAEDLTGTARTALIKLHEASKPMVVAVNKVDLLDDEARDEVITAIQTSLAGIIPPENVVATAAAPIGRRPILDPSGRTIRIETVRDEPDVSALRERMTAILAASGPDFRALARIKTATDSHIAEREQDRLRLRARAERVADETSAGLAIAMAINPVPVLGFLAGPGGLAILIHRVAAVYGEPMTAAMARGLASDLIRGGRKALWGSLATTIAGGFLKVVPGLGMLAGAVSQGASAGYFGHVVGRALVTYLENGKDWGDGGLVAELDRVAARTDRQAITRGLVDQIKARLRFSPPSRS